ncbi:MAG: hypothetical protein KH054_05130 [Firmicutes bacterium]|nr:hypothetical protein [Bacillota bacterium]
MQVEYEKNELVSRKKCSFFVKSLRTICEPMFLLLIIAASIYFI